jgi:hypothetical protein
MAAYPSQVGGEDRRGAGLTLLLMWASLRREARLALAFRFEGDPTASVREKPGEYPRRHRPYRTLKVVSHPCCQDCGSDPA